MSRHIRDDLIADLGILHHGRKHLKPATGDIRAFHQRAEQVLAHPLMTFDHDMMRCIAEAFATTIGACRYTCYTCAIMPDHIHVLIRKHRDTPPSR